MSDPLWIELTEGEQKIYVNMSLARRLTPGGDGTNIWFDNDSPVVVREPIEQVIRTAQREQG